MSSVNKVILVGNLGRDPEMRTFPSGDQIATVSVATTDKWKDKQSGEMREATEWHRVVFSGRVAEVAAQFLRKGSQVYVEGQLRTRKYQDKDGKDTYTTEIRADRMQMLGGKSQGEQRDDGYGGSQQQSGYARAPAPAPAAARNGYADQRGRQQPAPQQRQAPQNEYATDGFSDMDDDVPY